MPSVERTLILFKPDAVQRGLAGALLTRFENAGLKPVGLKLVLVSDELARKHYAVHVGKSFFPGLLAFITSSPVVAVALEGPRAITVARNLMGATDPAKAVPGSIRGDYGLSIGMNLVHGSDSPENAELELKLWFGPHELVSYKRDLDRWMIE